MAIPTSYFSEFKGKQSYSGTDIAVVFSIPYVEYGYLSDKHYKISAELQTITLSSTTSVLPVRRLGESKPIAFTRGGRTFAGSMIFTLLGEDPFREIFAIDALDNSTVNDGSWHIDQMPPFDIIIVAQNETGGIAVQIIQSARIVNWGTCYSVDDIYVENTYTYIAEHITPIYSGDLVFDTFTNNPFNTSTYQKPKTPDELTAYFEGKKFTARDQKLISQPTSELLKRMSAPGGFLGAHLGGLYVTPNVPVSESLDPAIPQGLLAQMQRHNNGK